MAAKYELKKSADGKFHFNLKAGNGEVILSREMYEGKPAAENGIQSVKTNSPLNETLRAQNLGQERTLLCAQSRQP